MQEVILPCKGGKEAQKNCQSLEQEEAIIIFFSNFPYPSFYRWGYQVSRRIGDSPTFRSPALVPTSLCSQNVPAQTSKWPEEYLILWGPPSGQLALTNIDSSQALTNIESSQKGRFPCFFSLYCCVGSLLTFLQSISTGDALLFFLFHQEKSEFNCKITNRHSLGFFLHMDK